MKGLKQALIPLSFEDERPTRITPADTPPEKTRPPVEQAPKEQADHAAFAWDNTKQQAKVKAVVNEPIREELEPKPGMDFDSPPCLPFVLMSRGVRFLNLQLTLKEEGTYLKGFDGLYGKGTAAAYDKAKMGNRQLQKYQLVAPYIDIAGTDQALSPLQTAINKIAEDTYNATHVLQASKEAYCTSLFGLH